MNCWYCHNERPLGKRICEACRLEVVRRWADKTAKVAAKDAASVVRSTHEAHPEVVSRVEQFKHVDGRPKVLHVSAQKSS